MILFSNINQFQFEFCLTPGLPRTNNAIEAWHGVLKKSIGASHISFFKFVLALMSEQSFQETRIAKIESGHDPEKTLLKYRQMNERLVKTVNSYDDTESFDLDIYVTQIAHNISF